MSAPDTRLDVRLVPMSAEQAMRCGVDLMRAYDAAPVDPVEVIYDELYGLNISRCSQLANRIALALGCVSARETNEKPA